MKLILFLCLYLLNGSLAQHQNVDPAYLRQYYQQLQQQQQGNAEATPIYEQNSEQTQQYVSPGQQYRVKDTVHEQIRAQQQQQQQQQQYVAPAVREYLQQQALPQQVQYQTQAPQTAYRHPAQIVTQPRRTQAQYQLQSAKKNKLKQQEDEEEYDDQNSSYQFGFDVKDDEFTNYQNRKEIRDGAVIKGSYSVVDSDGFIRTVKYTADPKEGFKAEVIREPTDIVVKIPTPPPQQQLLRPAHGSGNLKEQYHPYQQ